MDSIDKQLDELLRRSEIHLGDDGFTESVLKRLPKRKFSGGKSRYWTLASATALGSILTIILAPPIETAFGLFAILSAYQILMLAAFLFITVLAIPLAWYLYTRFVGDSWEIALKRYSD
jgi:hypothetical protein